MAHACMHICFERVLILRVDNVIAYTLANDIVFLLDIVANFLLCYFPIQLCNCHI